MNKAHAETLYTLLLSGAILFSLAMFMPEISVGDKKLDFVSFKTDTVKIQQVIAANKADSITDKLSQDTLVIKKLAKKVSIDPNINLKNADSITLANRIYNTAKDSSKPLDRFFLAIAEESDNTVVRVAHYGDSQLEGDRVTSSIRKNLQAKFGGGGPGYLPLDDVANSATYERSSALISRYNVFNNRLKSGLYGLSGNVYKALKWQEIKDDSTGKTTVTIPHVSFTMHDFFNFSRLKVITGKATKPLKIKVIGKTRDSSVSTILITDTAKQINYLETKLPRGVMKLNLQFTEGEGMVYAVMADAGEGIAVDNYAIRGHSGDGLTKINDNLLSDQLNQTNTRLIIFQYGNNMIPYIDDDKECKFYQTAFEKLFRKFRTAAPKASILVIGNGDMGYKKGDESLSYSHAGCLDGVLRDAAMNTGCAYWSMLNAMGGQGAIVTWTRKGYASLDGHLTPKGQKLISDLIFKALMLEYNDFIERYVKN